MDAAILEACLVETALKNTGKECDAAMVALAQIWATPPDFSLTREQLADPVGTFTTLMHAAKGTRIYPLFGQKAPIREINNAGGDDVSATLDDGLEVFLRFALYNITLATTSGGLCYAKALQQLGQSGYNALGIDQQGKGLFRKNSDDTFGSLITDYMTAPSPIQPDFKTTPYKNRFRYSYSPAEMVQNGVIMKNCTPLLSLMGLIDAVILAGETTQTTTNIYIKVQTECAGADLIAKWGNALGTHVNNFIVKDKADGSVVTPSAAAIVGGEIQLTGTYVSGHTYLVSGSAPSQWLTNLVKGYDAEESTAEIAIP